MKSYFVWALFTVAALASVSATLAQQSTSETEKTILALENQWVQADKTNNPVNVHAILTRFGG